MPYRPEKSIPLSIFILSVFLSCSANSEQKHVVKEPAAYRTSDYRSEVPLTVKGAKVIDSAQQLQSFLRKNEDSVLLDAFPAPHQLDARRWPWKSY